MKTVLVVGGAGYVGSHTTLHLAQYGYKVIILDSFVHGPQPPTPWATVVSADMADRGALESIFSLHKIAAVIHCAAFMDVGQSVKYPLMYYANNVANSITLLEVMAKYEVKQLVFCSSSAVYGVPRMVPIGETEPCVPINPYGMSKYMGEKIIEDAGRAHGIRSVFLRFFNVAGAHPGGYGLGEFHTPETHIIPLLLTAIRQKKPFHIFGGTYPTPDGTCIRDYVHVLDVADAQLKSLQFLEAGGTNCAVNIGSGIGTSVAQLVAMVEKVTNTRMQTNVVPGRVGDPAALVADISQASACLGWQPVHSDLAWIIKTACASEPTLFLPVSNFAKVSTDRRRGQE